MRAPDLTKGGRLAVTMTAATFLARARPPSRGDAEIFQHGADRLLGEGRVAQAVAGALQADDQAVADELVVARALQLSDVLDARGGCRAAAAGCWSPETAHGAGAFLADRTPPSAAEPRLRLGADRPSASAGCRPQQRSASRRASQPHHDAPTLIEPSAITVPENDLAAVDVAHPDDIAGRARLQRARRWPRWSARRRRTSPAPTRPARPARPRAAQRPGCSGRAAACAWRPCLRALGARMATAGGMTLPGCSVTSLSAASVDRLAGIDDPVRHRARLRCARAPAMDAATQSAQRRRRRMLPCRMRRTSSCRHLMFFETTAAISSAAWMTLEFIS